MCMSWIILIRFYVSHLFTKNKYLFSEPVAPRSLPWTPKVHLRDLDSFLESTRMKFVGFTLNNDRTTLAGLPPPIHEGVDILKSHLYKSLAELQIEVKQHLLKNSTLANKHKIIQISLISNFGLVELQIEVKQHLLNNSNFFKETNTNNSNIFYVKFWAFGLTKKQTIPFPQKTTFLNYSNVP
jgi:hypothetical protein